MAASFSYIKKSYAFYIYMGLVWVVGAVQALEGLTIQPSERPHHSTAQTMIRPQQRHKVKKTKP
jgi:hypothetical protein